MFCEEVIKLHGYGSPNLFNREKYLHPDESLNVYKGSQRLRGKLSSNVREDESVLHYMGIVKRICTCFRFGSVEENKFRCLIFILGLRSPCHAEIRLGLLSLLDGEPDVKKSCRGTESAAGSLTASDQPEDDQSSVNRGDPLHIRQSSDEYQKQSFPRYRFYRQRHYHRDCLFEGIVARTATKMTTKKGFFGTDQQGKTRKTRER
ncbi:hypothetical protein ACTXT7_008854 [Hymenolepis weldensis]